MTPPTMLVNLNGVLLPVAEAQVSALDHGLLYGDGLFETLRVYGGRFFRLEAHLERLTASARMLDFPLPWPSSALAEALHATVPANGIVDGSLRLTVTRGAGPPLPDPSLCETPTFLVTVRPWTPPTQDAWERGLSACVSGRHPRWHVPGLKTLCYLPFQQARVAARRQGCDEGLLELDGMVVEGATSNLFLVRNGELQTPPLESGCLPGITRAVVLELARQAGIPVRECELPTSTLADCEEIFLTNSLQEIMPVTRLEASPVRNGQSGPVTRRLHAAYDALVRRELAS